MSRNAGLLSVALALTLASGAASAADPTVIPAPAPAAAYAAGGCARGFEVIVAPYKEQVCHRGAAGYAVCEWVDREHEVRVPLACPAPVTSEDAWPAERGAHAPARRRVILSTRG